MDRKVWFIAFYFPVTSKNNSACWREEWEVWLRSVWDLWMIFEFDINMKCEKKTSSNVLDTHQLMPMSLLQPCKASKSKWMAMWAKETFLQETRQISFTWGCKERYKSQNRSELDSKNSCLSTLLLRHYVLRYHQSWRRISPRASATSCWYVHYETSKVGYFPVPVFAALFPSSWL